jgi:hypothetical protein
MAIQIETKDCTALSDAELAEMADMCTDGPAGFDLGLISKQPQAWVLITQARDEAGTLQGFSFCTLERIGGTPCVLIGMASLRPTSEGQEVLDAIMGDQLRRAWLAFPDEDVLVGTRLIDPSGFAAFRGLEDVVPRPGHRATGEERAWSRRLAKRFGAENRINDRTFVLTGDGDRPCALDLDGLGNGQGSDGLSYDPELAAFFEPLDQGRGDALIAFGWAMAEDLASRAAEVTSTSGS